MLPLLYFDLDCLLLVAGQGIHPTVLQFLLSAHVETFKCTMHQNSHKTQQESCEIQNDGLLWYIIHITTEVLQIFHCWWQACVSLWLVTMADENTFNSNRQHVAFLSLSQWINYATQWSKLKWLQNPSLLAFVSTSLWVLLIQSAHVHVWFAEKWLDLNLTCLTACFGNVMFAAYQPSHFLRGVCLCCREMSVIYMRH